MVSQTTSSKPTRLVTFGCSLTYGHGLPDCIELPNNPGDLPSSMGWPNTVAKYKRMSLLNMSKPGIGNRHIMHRILNFNFENTDTVVILWTNPVRWSRIFEDRVEDIGAWQSSKIAGMFLYYLSDDYDCMLSTAHNIQLSDYHIKNKGIEPVHVISNRYFFKDFPWNNAKLENYDFQELREQYPNALDGIHPGLEAHNEFAKLVIHSIDKRNLF